MPRKKKAVAEKEVVSNEEIGTEEVITEETAVEENGAEISSEETVTENDASEATAEEEVAVEENAPEEKASEDGADTADAPEEKPADEPDVATGKDLPEAVVNLLDFLADVYPESKFTAKVLEDQVKNIVVEFVMDEKIAFRQIVDINARIQTSKANLKGTVERNLSVYEKLSVEYLKKHNQTIEYMDQAEVKSIKTIKED